MMTAHDLMTEDPVTVPMMGKIPGRGTLARRPSTSESPSRRRRGRHFGGNARAIAGLAWTSAFPRGHGSRIPTVPVQRALDAPIFNIMSSNIISVDLRSQHHRTHRLDAQFQGRASCRVV